MLDISYEALSVLVPVFLIGTVAVLASRGRRAEVAGVFALGALAITGFMIVVETFA